MRLDKFKHSWWGWVVSVPLALYAATLKVPYVRGISLLAAVVIAVLAFRGTEHHKENPTHWRWACVLFVASGFGLFFAAIALDRISDKPANTKVQSGTPPDTKQETPIPQVSQPPNSTTPPKTTKSKLKEGTTPSQKKVKPNPTIAQNCPGGICAGGDINGSPTVNNFGPRPRVLMPQEASLIASQLGGSVPDGFEGINCIMGDAEGQRFGQQLFDVFKNRGWGQMDSVGQIMFERADLSGLFVATSPDDISTPPDGAFRVFSALRNAGLPVQRMTINGIRRGHYYVLVGNQP